MGTPLDSNTYNDVARFEEVVCQSLDTNLLPLVKKCQVMKDDLDEMKRAMGNQMDAVEDKFNELSLQVASLADRWLEELQEIRWEMMFLRRDHARVSLGGGDPKVEGMVSVPNTCGASRGKELVREAQSAQRRTKSAGQPKGSKVKCFICDGLHMAASCPHREMVRAMLGVGDDVGSDFEEVAEGSGGRGCL